MSGLSRLQWAGIIVGLCGVSSYILLMSWAMRTQSYASWGTMIVVPGLVIVNIVLIWSASRVERDSFVTKVLIAGFLMKGVGIFFRYVSVYFIYGKAGDAARYNDYAAAHYQAWREGVIVAAESAGGAGTLALERITTAVYVVIGPSPLAGFYVFGSMAFWGVYLIFRAFRTGFPDGQHRRYALLIFLLPSLLYWPSSIGKEAWILLFVGVFAYGLARFFRGHLNGLACVALGIIGIMVIRPHIAVLLMAAAALAQLLKPTDKSPAAFVGKVVGVMVMIVAVGYLVTSAADFLGLKEVTTESITERVETAAENTEQGGSAFAPVSLSSPIGVPAAVVTVLFRPFPWEAESSLALIQSLEGLILIVLLLRAGPRLRSIPRLLRDNPHLLFSMAYCVGFILAFSGFANFGILARQRVLMLPFFLMLLALPEVGEARRGKRPRTGRELTSV